MSGLKDNKLAFLSMDAPKGYVAGLGRGASGFTTRSDIGPAREGPSEATVAAAKERRGEIPEGADEGGGDDDDEDRYQDAEDDAGLFANGVYEKDDEDADRVYGLVDRHMDERRRKRREEREQEELLRLRQERPKIQAQFADLKRGLAAVTEEQWEHIPEASNLTGKRRKAAAKRESRNTSDFVVPDSVLLANRDRGATESSIDPRASLAGADSGAVTSLVDIGSARNKVFSHHLDVASSGSQTAMSGLATTVNPQAYSNLLDSSVQPTHAQIGDIQRTRTLLESVLRANPTQSGAWISRARLEEMDNKRVQARKIIAKGCDMCPKSEEVWLEAVRLNTRDNGKVILARAVQHLTQSIKIWLKAAELETDPHAKRNVLRKSVEFVPTSVQLWKELINLEDTADGAKALLGGALDAVPQSVEFWLTLARLSGRDEAREVLNSARKKVPTSHEIWIAALRLMEEQGTPQKDLDAVMVKAIKSLRKNGAVLTRDEWLREAEKAEKENASPLTSAAIIRASIAQDLEEEDREAVWTADAQAAEEKGSVHTARTIFAYTLEQYPRNPQTWMLAVELERNHGTDQEGRQRLFDMLERAVGAVPAAEDLWLLYAQEQWNDHNLDGARNILARAFNKNMGSEAISLAAARLESEHGGVDGKKNAFLLLQRARREVGTERVWIKSVIFERTEGHLQDALALVEEALDKYPGSEKLHLMHAQLTSATAASQPDGVRAARSALERGRKSVPNGVNLWISSSRLEEKAGLSIRARALLDKARLTNPHEDRLWAESIAVEQRVGATGDQTAINQAKVLLARGIQDCPKSGLLAEMAVWAEAKSRRRTTAADGLRRTDNDARVLATVARLFWNERIVDKARAWFERAADKDPDWGDGWAWWYKFELAQGNAATQAAVLQRTLYAKPHHGEIWQTISKDPERPNRPLRQVLELTAAKLKVVT